MTTIHQAPVDAGKLERFVFRAVDEVGATLNAALVVMGDRLGLYRALAGAGPLTPRELAARTGTAERYVREWLNAQAARRPGGPREARAGRQRGRVHALPPRRRDALQPRARGPAVSSGGGLEPIALEHVDAVAVTTLVDNVTDSLLPDQGPAARSSMTAAPRIATRLHIGGDTDDALRAEHGFSALVTVKKAGRETRVLFDAGRTPDGLVENMRRLDLSPGDIDIIVLSHGHWDHVTGMDGLVHRLGSPSMPVVIHPEFWTRRRLAFPGRDGASTSAGKHSRRSSDQPATRSAPSRPTSWCRPIAPAGGPPTRSRRASPRRSSKTASARGSSSPRPTPEEARP